MKTQTQILKIKNMIEKEAPSGDLKPYWLRWRRRWRLPRAEEGKRESSGGEVKNVGPK
jgi:hypothetical protein